MSIDAIVDLSPATGLEPGGEIRAAEPSADVTAPEIRLSAAAQVAAPENEQTYSEADLGLFHALTGYRLAAMQTIWIVVDDEGKRAPFADRLFTALAEEAFRFADRHRRGDGAARQDLTPEDLARALAPLERISSQIGSRGVAAFRRFEAALLAQGQAPALIPFEAMMNVSSA